MGGVSIISDAASSLHENHYKPKPLIIYTLCILRLLIMFYIIFDASFTNYRNGLWNFLLGFVYGSNGVVLLQNDVS